ncbi:FecR family protein [Pontibacter liquoris]|uniref:FecR family protein n=1 Tax=Pontibacter liquoris TaxID=2905677 RepID=UPI001FA70761|nr:FecR family protein [Pontibacter liquoris]
MDSRLLDRFYKGECSEEEVQAVLEWFKKNKVDHKRESDLYVLWQEATRKEAEKSEHDADQVFRRIRARIEETQHQEPEASGKVIPFRRKPSPLLWAKVAAAVLLPLLLIGVLIQFTSRAETAVLAYKTIEAAPGVKKTILLPDGSKIKLNAGSKVSFLESFAAQTREITLQGEAFFEVAKDKQRPFIVHTGSISTQALGTSFNIDYRLYDSTITVALATGVVKVEKENQGQQRQLSRLTPGQQLFYDKASQQYTVSPFDREKVLGWTRGVLHFDGADREQVIRALENWYGVAIDVDTSSAGTRPWNYTGEYHNESLEKVLEGIGYVKGFTYKRTDKNVKIMFNQPDTL